MHEKNKSMWVSVFLLTGKNHVLWQLWFQRPEAHSLSSHPFLSPSATSFHLCLSVCCYDVGRFPHTQRHSLDACLCLSACTASFSMWKWKYVATSSHQPQSKLSRGLNAAPSSPPCSGSSAGWCPPPWSASSLWTQPPPPAGAHRPQTRWRGWSMHGCCTNSSGGQTESSRS